MVKSRVYLTKNMLQIYLVPLKQTFCAKQNIKTPQDDKKELNRLLKIIILRKNAQQFFCQRVKQHSFISNFLKSQNTLMHFSQKIEGVAKRKCVKLPILMTSSKKAKIKIFKKSKNFSKLYQTIFYGSASSTQSTQSLMVSLSRITIPLEIQKM